MAFETTSLFDVIAADDTDHRVSSRRALALAHTRVDNHLGRFLTAAVTAEDFDARLAAVQDQFASYVADACSECGHDHPEHIASSLVDHYSRTRRWQPRNIVAAPNMMQLPAAGPMPNMSPLPTASPQQFDQMGAHPLQQAEQMGGSLPPGQAPGGMAPQPVAPQGGVNPAMQQAQQMLQQQGQQSQQPPQQNPGMGNPLSLTGSVDEGRDFLASADDDPSAQDDDSSRQVACPECGGTGKTNGGKTCPKCGGKGKVANFGDSMLDHVARVADAEGNTGLGKPEPTMNKNRWTPQSLEKRPGDDSKMHPTKEKDILEPIPSSNRDQPGHELKEIGEQTTKRVDLPAAGDTDYGFYDGGEVKGPSDWQKGKSQVDPVTHTKQ